MKTLDASDLYALGRNLPEELFIQAEDTADQLCIQQVSRYLVKRRLSGPGIWRGRPVFIKTFFGKFKAEREHRQEVSVSQALQQRCIQAPALLGWGRIQGGGYWLAQELLPNLKSFKEIWRESEGEGRQQAIAQLMGLLSAMYAHGFYQADAHLENFAFSDGRLFVLDAGGIKSAAFFQQRLFLNNLALLLAQFNWSEHLFLVDLCLKNNWVAQHFNSEMLRTALAKSWRTRVKKLSDKMLRSSSWVSILNGRNIKAFIRREYLSEECRQLFHSCANLDDAIARGEILKAGNSATVARIDVAGESYVLKRYNIKNMKVALKRSFKASRARNSWLASHMLNLMGVNTSDPVAFAEEKKFFVTQRAYFLSRCVPGDSAWDYIPANPQDDSYLEAFSELFEALIYSQVSHGDMKATNFHVGEDGVFLIDLDAMKMHGSKQKYAALIKKDLDRFMKNWDGCPKTDARFLKVVKDVSAKYGIQWP